MKENKKEKGKIFVIMPFQDEFFESYEMLKRQFSDNFEFSNAGEEDNQQNILADIIAPIYEADIILADLTGLNPNVMYELGIAHTLNKKTIIITKDDLNKLPFDLKQYRAKDYTTHFVKFDELLSYLDKNFNGAIDGSVLFSNPVKDFIDKSNINTQQVFEKSSEYVTAPVDEKGFVDFLAEIEEDTNNMTEDVNVITMELNTMNEGINKCTREIERVNANGGKGTANFVRKQTKKVAEYMDNFSKVMRNRTESIESLWDKVENNVFELLENKFIEYPENHQPIIEYLKALNKMKCGIINSNEGISCMKEASLKSLGIERSLNQAIRFLDDDLNTYIAISEKMYASIDKIIHKGEFVVGKIDFD